VQVLSESLLRFSNESDDRQPLVAAGQPNDAQDMGVLASRYDLETCLTRILEETTGIPTVGIHQNFFELGVDSLLIARLLARIERELGRRLTFLSVVAAPTIQQIAALLHNSSAPTRSTQLFPIQPEGSKSPFFCIGVTIGGGFFYRPLAERLRTNQPVLGLQLDQSIVDQLHTPYSIEELAGYMVQAIRKQQPQGPYFLGGFCDNGTLVYETARQLLKEGHPVALLAIFDACNLAYFERRSNGHGYRRLWRRVPFHLHQLQQMKSADACRYIAVRVKALWQTAHKNASGLFKKILTRKSAVRLTDVAQIFYSALERYNPKPYPGRVAFFRAEAKEAEDISGWFSVITGPTELHDISGYHMEMFLDPHVDRLASRLTASIDKASALPDENVNNPGKVAVSHPLSAFRLRV
jgi:thioesterase domain-containing protein/aryl carrier-like protein